MDGTGNRTRQGPGPDTQTTAAHAAQDQRRRDPPGTTPSRVPERVRRGASPAPLPRQRPAAGTKSPVLRRPPRAVPSRQVNPGVQAPGMGKDTRASIKPTGAARAIARDEVQRTNGGPRGHQTGTPPATTKAHRQVPSNNGHRVPQTWTARTTGNEPRHGNRCEATSNPHTTNPSQELRGKGGGRTPTHTPRHPSQQWCGAAETRAQTHTMTPHTLARIGGLQAECAPKHTHTPQHPSQEWRGAVKTRAQAHTPTPQTPARIGAVQAERTHQSTQPNTSARNGGAQPKPEPKHTHPHHTPQPGLAGYRRSAHTKAHNPTTLPRMAGRSRSPNPSTHTHTAHPGKDWRGPGGAHTPKHTTQHPSQERRDAAKT